MSILLSQDKKGKRGVGQFSGEKEDFHKPSAHNPIFKKELVSSLGCPYCKSKKHFKNLWTLYMHIRLNHQNEKQNFKSVIWTLADFVIRGILK
jgi:hypothetical protein